MYLCLHLAAGTVFLANEKFLFIYSVVKELTQILEFEPQFKRYKTSISDTIDPRSACALCAA